MSNFSDDETFDDNADIELETEAPKKKRGRKSAKDKELQSKENEEKAVNDFEFQNREILSSEFSDFKITCGKCLFYSRQATYGIPCEQRGIVGADTPCSRFQYNVMRVQHKNIQNLTNALAEISKCGISLPELSALMINSRPLVLKNMGFKINQKVWFSISPHPESQSADTWYSAVIIGEKNGKILVVMENGSQPSLPPSMLLTEEEFNTIEMKVPEKKREAIEQIHGLKLKIRTIDDAVKTFGEKEEDEKPAVKRGRKPKLQSQKSLSSSKERKKSIRLRG